jgi:glycosyltransferase involved in cell wall biosynthesis
MAGRADTYLLLSTATNIGGMERLVAGLARQLALGQWRPRVALPTGEDSKAAVSWFVEQGIDAFSTPDLTELGSRHTLRGAAGTWRLVMRETPAVAHFHFGSTFISLRDVVAARAAGVRHLIVTVHGAEAWSVLGGRKRRLTRYAAMFCDAVVTVSHASAALLREAGVPDAVVHVIPPGVRSVTHIPRGEARQRLGLSPDALVVATLARLVPGKGISDLIEAAALARRTQPRLELLIGGEGPERAALQAHAGRVLPDAAHFVGEVRDTASLYGAADLFVLPSYTEGLPLVLVEAALAGVAAVATNVGGIPEIIEDGTTGLLVAARRPHDLAAAITRLAADSSLRERLAATARERAKLQFSEARMASAYAALVAVGR